MKKRLSFCLFLSFAMSFSAMAKDVAPQVVNAADGAIDISTSAPAEINGIPSVTERIAALFSSKKPPVSLTSSNFKEMPPDFVIIPGADDMSTLIYRCRYINPEAVVDSLEAVISASGTVEVIKDQGSTSIEVNKIVIHDLSGKMTELKNVLVALDQMQPQVLVETQVVEVYIEEGAERDFKLEYQHYDAKYGTLNTFGFNLDSPSQDRDATSGAAAGFVPYAFNATDGSTGRLNAAIRWLNTSSNARILSAPNVIADQGTTASIITGEDLPIPETTALTSSTSVGYNYKRIGVTLNITPTVINGNTVQLQVNPEVKAAIRYQNFVTDNTSSSIPVISVRSVDTRLTVCDGDIIALGGLYSSETTEQLRKIPYIGDIPLLGDLLNGRGTSTLDKQLIFLMKIHILQPPKMQMLNLNATAEQSHGIAEILNSSNELFTNKPPAEFFDLEKNLNQKVKDYQQKKEEKEYLESRNKADAGNDATAADTTGKNSEE